MLVKVGAIWWMILIILNTFFLLQNIILGWYIFSFINFLTALCCWAAYYQAISKKDSTKEDKHQ